MLKSVTVTNYLGESIKLILTMPETSGIYIENITGLGPVHADINTTEVTTDDGAIYNSARATKRNIVMTVGFLQDVETNRQKTYKYFPLKKPVKLLFETANRKIHTTGYVESNEPNIFSERETSQISIICPKSYFYSLSDTVTNFYSFDPLFEFPFDNNDTAEPLLELGSIAYHNERLINYTGDVENGINIHIEATGNVDGLKIYNLTTRERMTINNAKISALTGSGIVEGDVIDICTIKGSKYIHLIRNNKTINILNCIEKDADWFQLSVGENKFFFKSADGLANLRISLTYNILYEGV